MTSQSKAEETLLNELLESALERAAAAERPADFEGGSPVVVGQVVDTHHPHLAGRVLVRFTQSDGKRGERWVEYERRVALYVGQRVLLTRPVDWVDWIVTGALGASAAVAGEPPQGRRLELAPGEQVQIVAHDGTPLMKVSLGDQGPRVELCGPHVELHAERTLALTGDTVEIRAGAGGVDIRTDGDAIVRGRFIRLN